jgi:serine/threonine protein kinase
MLVPFDYSKLASKFLSLQQLGAASSRKWSSRNQGIKSSLCLFLSQVKALETHKVVHYDLKCDNILLEPLHSPLSNTEFWHPPWPPSDKACSIPFRVCITDFGQSKVGLWIFYSPKYICNEVYKSREY